MGIKPLFKWFGSKFSATKHYPEPEYDTIVEPFAGAAGYSLNYADLNVTIFDTDPNVRDLWQWLIGPATSADVLVIPVEIPKGTDIRTIGLTHGQALLVKHWQRLNNVGDCWTISCMNNLPGMWSVNTRARVAEQLHAVKHWRFEDVPWTDEGVTYFLDPPYLYNYRYRDGKAFDFEEYARKVNAIPAASQVIACEGSCPKTGAQPTYLPFKPSHRQVTSRRKATQHHHSEELIYCR